MATATYKDHEGHSYPPLPPLSHDIDPSETNTSLTSSFAKNRFPLDDDTDNDTEPHPFPKDVAPQWDQQPAPLDPQRPARKWWQGLFPKSLPITLFLATVIIETIVDLALQGDIYLRLHALSQSDNSSRDQARRVSVYLAIFALAHVFQLVVAIDAVISQNTLQFFFLTLFNFILLLYSIIESVEISQFGQALETENLKGISSIPIMALLYISHAVLAISEVAYIALAWQVWREFGWKVYKFLGADIAIKRMFAHYQIFLCLVKFDLFFWVGFSVQLIYLVLSEKDMEYYLTILALPLSLLLLVEGHLAARYENKWLMGSFILGCLAACVYFVYKLFRIWEQANGEFKDVYKSLTVFAAISLFFLLVTSIWAIIVMRNFGRGLKVHLSKRPVIGSRKRGGTVDWTNRKSGMTLAANTNRMSIE